MKQITLSDFRELSVGKMQEILPCIVTASIDHGEVKPFIVMGKPEDIVIIADLPILMRQKILATEQLARAGMPKPEEVNV